MVPTQPAPVSLSPCMTAKGKLSPPARKSGVLTSQWEIHVCMISQWAHLTFVNDATQTCRWCFSNEVPGERLLKQLIPPERQERKEERTLRGEKWEWKETIVQTQITSKLSRCSLFCFFGSIFVALSKQSSHQIPVCVCCWSPKTSFHFFWIHSRAYFSVLFFFFCSLKPAERV